LKLDETGMVMDFTKVKHLVNDFIDSFDHSLMINANDHLMVELGRILSDRYVLLPYNPTAELMAVHFFAYIYSIPELAPFIHSVQVYETETSWAQCDHADYGQMSDLISFGKERFSKAVATGWNDETRARLVVDHYEVLEKRTITVLNGRNLGVALDSPSVQ
jgi:6-pyruvoyl-tetrahydropterin synthase